MVKTADVAVVGGGPGGTSAAILLAKAGLNVVLLDKAKFPRDKCCGDGLTTGALRQLAELGLDPRNVESWTRVDDVRLQSPSGRVVCLNMPEAVNAFGQAGTFAAIARRSDLDAATLQLARDSGVEVHEGHGLIGVMPDHSDQVQLIVEGLDGVAARYVIGADGMWSTLRKAIGDNRNGYLGEWHAFRQYFSGVTPKASSELWVWFYNDLLPGYAWSFPLGNGMANFGFGIQRRQGQSVQSMKQKWEQLLERESVSALLGPGAQAESPTPKAWPIPASIKGHCLSAANGRVLFVGDAARAADPMTGEGIGQALETGMLAARSIIAAGATRPEHAAEQYRREINRGLQIDNQLAGVLSHILGSPFGARASARVIGSSQRFGNHFVRWLFEDYPRAALINPYRWRSLARRVTAPY